ncbi:hypothetical protein [Dyella subtropica]|uniref:hypothetical protein n=1 Tax=Dyella subtropica TaxID=2992127 RepID=UPI00224D6107|nr:hypothetical protein [Dyella subtropica]
MTANSVSSAAYCQGFFADHGGAAYVEQLKKSGFNTVILALGHPHEQADIYYGNTLIIRNGVYVGPVGWPELVASLLKAPTTVNRVLFSIGGADVGDFGNIANLIKKYGTGPETALYRNFHALKSLFPAIECIDLDDEEQLQASVIVQFSLMLGRIGLKTTFCPYYQPTFWVDCLKQIEKEAPGQVVGFNLQCYSGGGGNEPAQWIAAIRQVMGDSFPATFVTPGLSSSQTPDEVREQFEIWRTSGINSGFLWTYEDAGNQAPAYAQAIRDGLQHPLQGKPPIGKPGERTTGDRA